MKEGSKGAGKIKKKKMELKSERKNKAVISPQDQVVTAATCLAGSFFFFWLSCCVVCVDPSFSN